MTEHNPEQMTEMLLAGARLTGTHTARAAAHLLTFTELPGRASFVDLVDVVEETDRDGRQVTAAYVTDWAALPAKAGYLTGGDARLLSLAASLAAGEPVDLRENLPGLGTAYARRAIEAVVIATGHDELYTVTTS